MDRVGQDDRAGEGPFRDLNAVPDDPADKLKYPIWRRESHGVRRSIGRVGERGHPGVGEEGISHDGKSGIGHR